MSNYRSVIGLAVALFLTLASATAFSASKIEALGLARLKIEELKIEKLGALDELRRDLKSGQISRAQYKAGVQRVKSSFRGTISTARVAFQALKVELRGAVSDDVIDKAESDFNAAIDKAIESLNGFLLALAKDLGIPPDDIAVSPA